MSASPAAVRERQRMAAAFPVSTPDPAVARPELYFARVDREWMWGLTLNK